MAGGSNDGRIACATCSACGFTDYVTDEQWCDDNGGVWAFKWWRKYRCPKCGGEGTIKIYSGHYGMVVIWDEKEIEVEETQLSSLQKFQDARGESVEAEGVGGIEGE